MQIIPTKSPVLHVPIFSISEVSVHLWHLTFPELPRQVPKNGTTTGGGMIFILFFYVWGVYGQTREKYLLQERVGIGMKP